MEFPLQAQHLFLKARKERSAAGLVTFAPHRPQSSRMQGGKAGDFLEQVVNSERLRGP